MARHALTLLLAFAVVAADDPLPRRRAGGPARVAAAPDVTQIDAGQALYAETCAMCHQPAGTGKPGLFPPLAGSDFLARDPQRIVAIVLHGLAEPIVVNGEEYNGAMPPLDRLSDADIANVTTFVLNSWSNPGGVVTAEQVAARRTSVQ